tara:strand:- start:312 stop:740 length:429 start_codon:yes stop_codon:yes gene_type:complete
MIKYNLFCKDCETNFDSWFSSSVEFERIKKMKLLNCNHCDSQNIGKSLMTPNLLNTKKNKKTNDDKKFSKLKNKLKKYQKFIKNNFDYVGDNFTYEARSIHYNNKKNNKKGIYGNASSKDIKELGEEGIETQLIPWVRDSEN